MLFKLAIQNMRRSKGYFIAYILTVAIFFTIIYQVSNIEVQLDAYMVDQIKMSQIKITDAFFYLKGFLYVIVVFFAAYIARFFIKRRSKEVALLKTLGLNRKNIWYIFLIENIIIVLFGIIFGLIFGVLISRLTAMIAFDMMGLGLLEVKMTLIVEGLRDVGILALITYVIISLIPLRTIAKSSIIELLNDQVKGDEIKRKPIVSTILFVIATAFLLFLMFIYMPKTEFIDVPIILTYFVTAIVVACLLYRGPVSYFFINYRKKQKGIKSPIKMLSFNHLGSKVSGLSRMMSFITVVSATMVAILIFTFGMINKMEDGLGGANEMSQSYPNLKFITKEEGMADKIEKDLIKQKEGYARYKVYSYGKTITKPTDMDIDILSYGTLVFKESDINKALKADGKKEIKLNKNEFLVGLSNDFKEGNRKNLEKVIKVAGFNKNQGKYNQFEESPFEYFSFQPIEEMNPTKKELAQRINYADIIVLPDNNRVFNKIQKLEVVNLTNKVTKKNAFSLFNTFFESKDVASGKVLLSSDLDMNIASTYIVMGLFQVIFLMASIVVTIALMMAIFFRTLENLEGSINDYIIAKQVGLKRMHITISVFIEAFVSQLLPFIIGGGVSMVMFNQMLAGKLEGLDNIIPLLQEKATATILLSLSGLLIFLLVILMYIVLKQIYRLKAIKAE